MAIVHVGIDLAKNVFALHGVNANVAVQLRQPQVARCKLNEVMAALPPCVIGIEACTGAHDGPGCLLRTATPSSSWRPSWWRRTA